MTKQEIIDICKVQGFESYKVKGVKDKHTGLRKNNIVVNISSTFPCTKDVFVGNQETKDFRQFDSENTTLHELEMFVKSYLN